MKQEANPCVFHPTVGQPTADRATADGTSPGLTQGGKKHAATSKLRVDGQGQGRPGDLPPYVHGRRMGNRFTSRILPSVWGQGRPRMISASVAPDAKKLSTSDTLVRSAQIHGLLPCLPGSFDKSLPAHDRTRSA